MASHTLRNLWLYEPDADKRARIVDQMFPVEVNFDVSQEEDF